MSTDDLEQQADELEVLQSIYSDDDAFFNKVSDTVFQFKYGSEGTSRSFVLQISWPSDYPSVSIPCISLDLFYNKHISAHVKQSIISRLTAEAEANQGMASTFTLVEYVKDNIDDLLAAQPETLSAVSSSSQFDKLDIDDSNIKSKENNPKVQLTKQQKRRMWDKGGLESDSRERGWNWVDVIKHLSQTGSQNMDHY